jgi:putative endonuclease
MNNNAYVYIIGNDRPTLYIGVTSNLVKRIYEHKNHLAIGFSLQYDLQKLLYFEVFETVDDAIKREKQLKNWHRDWKMNLIKQNNPEFKDLYGQIV